MGYPWQLGSWTVETRDEIKRGRGKKPRAWREKTREEREERGMTKDGQVAYLTLTWIMLQGQIKINPLSARGNTGYILRYANLAFHQ